MPYMSKRQTTGGVVPIASNMYGSCTSAASAVTKAVTMPDFDVLVPGVTIHVYFQYGNTASNPVLQVGSTAGKGIGCNGALKGVWEAGSIVSFTYNGSHWMQNDVQEGGHTYGLSLSGDTLSIVESGGSSSVTLDLDDTTYTISISGNVITLTDSNGGTQTVTIPSVSDFTGATHSSAGVHGLVPAPSMGMTVALLMSNGNWAYISPSDAQGTIIGNFGSNLYGDYLIMINDATQSVSGLMSPTDKAKLDSLSTQTLTPTVSVSTGTLGSYSFKRYGNVMDVILSVSNSASVASGQNIFVGTFSGIPLPSQNLRGTTYYGARILGTGFASGTGVINLYNAYSSALSGVSTDIHFTYIVD